MRPGLTTATQNSGFPLPLPIRVSAGFLVTGLSGKIRMKILPPRLTLRARDTRAASICRFVTHPGSSALRPKSPKASVEPRWARPFMRPRWALRYLTRLGINMVLCLDDPLGGQDLALEDPHLDADGAERRVGLRQPVVDVGADRMQRNPPLAVPLSARDLGAAQPPRARDPDPVRSEPEGGGHRLLHGPPERHALLELQGHVLGHQLGVELRVHDLLD